MSNRKYSHRIEQIRISLQDLSLLVFCSTCCSVVSQHRARRSYLWGSRLRTMPWSYYRSSAPQPHSGHVLCCTGDFCESAFHLLHSQFGSLSMSITFINYSLFITLIQALITPQFNCFTASLLAAFPPMPNLYRLLTPACIFHCSISLLKPAWCNVKSLGFFGASDRIQI